MGDRRSKNRKKSKTGPGRPRICQDPRSKNVTFEAATLETLQNQSREERRTVPELIRLAVDTFLDPESVTIALDSDLSDQLEAISRADPNGRLSKVQMAQRALVEYAGARCSRPDVQQVLASMEVSKLRLIAGKRRVNELDESGRA